MTTFRIGRNPTCLWIRGGRAGRKQPRSAIECDRSGENTIATKNAGFKNNLSNLKKAINMIYKKTYFLSGIHLRGTGKTIGEDGGSKPA